VLSDFLWHDIHPTSHLAPPPPPTAREAVLFLSCLPALWAPSYPPLALLRLEFELVKCCFHHSVRWFVSKVRSLLLVCVPDFVSLKGDTLGLWCLVDTVRDKLAIMSGFIRLGCTALSWGCISSRISQQFSVSWCTVQQWFCRWTANRQWLCGRMCPVWFNF
jgi:hypothetical protein